MRVYVNPMNHISLRDLQKLSGEAIGALPGPTPVKSGDRTVGLLIPLKAADPDRLAAVLTRAEALAQGRDSAADDAALAPFGEVDPVAWSEEAVRAFYGRAVERRDMNTLLEKALAEVARLPEEEQEAIATLILDEIAAERGWDERFAKTQDQLGALVRSARAEVARGDVVSGDPSDRPAK